MKLEEGMYVRTEKGMMAKIISKEDVSGSLHKEEIVFILDNGNRLALNSRKVIKARYNIIDLIEEGDYVNGYSVIEKPYSYLGIKFISLDTDTSWGWGKGEMPAENIKSVLTREQFNNEKYVVNEVE